jgi:hypothetical protein
MILGLIFYWVFALGFVGMLLDLQRTAIFMIVPFAGPFLLWDYCDRIRRGVRRGLCD